MKKYSYVVDAVAVILFVVIGRSAHGHGEALGGIISTLWPFIVGTGFGWTYVAARHRDIASWSSGVEITVATVAVGMTLRVLAGQGTAFAFVVVALVFLGLFFVGWRVVVTVARRRPLR